MRGGEIPLPFGGRYSACKKHQTSLTERQLRMISKLEDVGQEFMKTTPPLPIGFKGSDRIPLCAGSSDPNLNRTMGEDLQR